MNNNNLKETVNIDKLIKALQIYKILKRLKEQNFFVDNLKEIDKI